MALRRALAALLVLVVALASGGASAAPGLPPPDPNCTPNGTTRPDGQSSQATDDPQVPLWCYTLQPGVTSRVSGQNDWLDNFETGTFQRFDDFDANYRVVQANSEGRIKMASAITGDYFAADVVDTSAFRLSGGVFHSPARSFQFENGKLVIEADMAAGNFNMGGADVFQEIDISPAAEPTGITVDPLYGYGGFGGAGAIGCRFQTESGVGETVCSFYNNSTRDAGGADVTCNTQPNCPTNGLPGRIWETQGAGAPLASVNAQYTTAGFWRHCAPDADDGFCFDRFRIELTKDSLVVWVNGTLQRELRGITTGRNGQDGRVPDAWFSPPGVHVYFTDWINSGQHTPQRFFWDRLAINPHNPDGSAMPRSVADSFCPTQPLQTCAGGGPPPGTPGVPTATPAATSTPTSTPAATAVAVSVTSTPTLGACQVRTQIRLNGVERPISPYRNC